MLINLATSLLLPSRRSLARANANFRGCVDNHHGAFRGAVVFCVEDNIWIAPWKCCLRYLSGLSSPTRDLNRILLNLAQSREFSDGSSRHGYDFIAPLDADGHIDPALWRKYRNYCRVRRFWQGQEDEVGRLVHKPGYGRFERRISFAGRRLHLSSSELTCGCLSRQFERRGQSKPSGHPGGCHVYSSHS
jgi:hypothetical protein